MIRHRYSVQFRIYGDIIPDEVTRRLGLEPNHTRSIGDVLHGRKCEEALWSYSGAPEGVFVEEWDNLENGLLHLINKIWSKKYLIDHYMNNYKTVWWCSHFQSSFDGGPWLSQDLLTALADFGSPIYIDNYFSDD